MAGVVANSCVLVLNTSGVLAASPDGTTLASDVTGGSPASLNVTALGTAPTINFSAPALITPTGFSGTPVTSYRFQSTRGTSKPYTTVASSQPGTALLETFTVHGRVTNTTGFAEGQYRITTTATCQQ